MTLVLFTVAPDVVTPTDVFTISVGLDEPTPTPVAVALSLDGTSAGAMGIAAGTSTSDESLTADNIGLAPGTYEWGASLGAVSLTASLTVQ